MEPFTTSTISSVNLKLVEDEYSKLEGTIDELGTLINTTLENQKKEQERMHQGKMKRVEEVIEQHKKEKTRLEDEIANNHRACQLEIERDWFKKEALHLDEVIVKKKTEIKSLLKNLETLSQDKVCLKAEINKLAMQNTALENKFKELGVNDVVSADEKDSTIWTKNAKSSPEDKFVKDVDTNTKDVDTAVEKAKNDGKIDEATAV